MESKSLAAGGRRGTAVPNGKYYSGKSTPIIRSAFSTICVQV
jgi:hypothetical protein